MWYVRPVCLSSMPMQHELLGEELAGRPAVVGGLAQAVGDLAEQRVAAVGRAEVQDRALVGDGDEVALVVRGALAQVLQVAGDVDAADEAVRVGEVVDVVDADARHADHVQDDGAVVGQLDAGGVGLERRAGRRHQVRAPRTSSCRPRRRASAPRAAASSPTPAASCCRRPRRPGCSSRRRCAPRSGPCPSRSCASSSGPRPRAGSRPPRATPGSAGRRPRR